MQLLGSGGGDGSSVDLSGFATKDHMEQMMADFNKKMGDIDLSKFVTNQDLDKRIGGIDMSSFVS